MARARSNVTRSDDVKNSLEELNLDIRAGGIDQDLLDFDRLEPMRYRTIPRLLGFLGAGRNGHRQNHRNVRTASDENGRNCFNPRIVKLLTQSYLEEQVLGYVSRFPERCPSELTPVYEFLEMIRFDGDFVKGQTLHFGSRLEYFRMAQKIRNEFGIARSGSSSECFSSFEDIARLEKDLEEDEPVDFLRQCLALRLPDCRHIYKMWCCFKTHAQLAAFACEVSIYGDQDFNLSLELLCGNFFEALEDSSPSWAQLRRYLTRERRIHRGLATLFGAEIPQGRVDEALSTLIKFLGRCIPSLIEYVHGHGPSKLETVVAALKLLLDRGASLLFRDLDETCGLETSSLSKLLELRYRCFDFSLVEFFPYICCPLAHEGYAVRFDNWRVVRLSCLAARSVRNLEKRSIPNVLRPSVRMHQELHTAIRTRILSKIL